jgi:hypothetical protein
VTTTSSGSGPDRVLEELVADARADPGTLGLLLHGSRALDRHRPDSDYDLMRVVTDAAHAARREHGGTDERITRPDGVRVETFFVSETRMERDVTEPDWYTPMYLSARLLFDRIGTVAERLERLRREAGRIARERTPAAYDDYLNSYVRSLKSARRGDEIGRRMHAAGSAASLIRVLFGVESAWPPYHDGLAAALPALEQAQGWPAGYLTSALTRLVGDADPAFQRDLETRVEALMAARGVLHEWGDELDAMRGSDPP